MGGPNSGNHGGRPTVEDGLVLDLHRLIRQGLFKPRTWRGSIVWTDVYRGEETARIGYEAHMGEERGWARLIYTTTSYWTGEKTNHDYRIEMTTRPQPFGGRRWFWICPRRGDLVAKLYKPNGGGIFASRKSHRLAYRSQRESPNDRSLNRAFKLRRRLGSVEGIGDYIRKPKGMRWATFQNEMRRVHEAEAILEGHTLMLVQRLNRHLTR